MKFKKFVFPALLLAASLPALAASRTVTLDVPGMTCPVCPITVRKALRTVRGVTHVDVRYAKKEAIVTYDDTKTSISALTKATADAGYPSKPEGTAK